MSDEMTGALCLDEHCGHRAVWHHDDRGCMYHGNSREHRCHCRLTSDEVVERIIDARLAPIRALAGWWDSGPTKHIDTMTREVAALDLRAALDAASAPVSAQQDHDGTQGQGEDERAAGGDDGFLDYILDRSCPCGPHGEVHP